MGPEGLLLSGDCYHCTAQLKEPWVLPQCQEYLVRGRDAVWLDTVQVEPWKSSGVPSEFMLQFI